MTSRFNNKVALVTGAASGIGLCTVERLISEGARVLGTDVDPGALDRLGKKFGDDSFKARVCDVTDRAATEDAVKDCVSSFGGIDILVNSAGISRRNVPEGADFEQAWDAVIDVNLKGTLLMSHAAAHAMRAGGNDGAIVNIGSIMSYAVYHPDMGLSDGFNPYPHSKGGVIQMTRDAAVHLAADGIRVNAVCPGFIETQLTATLGDNPGLHKTISERHPMKRFGQPEEVANVIVFLASSEASFVTGVAWRVDGGYLAC